ncbi:hypothetical protein [Shimia thalassica]|uniref:hypothetical protein n=1 Tax=Shimia thalassica TaxID=1715693 RepID=UPI0026E15D3B|nr:hypothetical protein [Shimia thalassica]MDO6483561.1 hypothetical protein [Shimia thalassica]
MMGWERIGDLQVCTVRDGPDRRLIATVRHAVTRQTVATATPDAVTYHVPSSDDLKAAVDAALSAYHANLKEKS